LIGGAYMEANEEVIKIFRPKKWYNHDAKN
jgi:hypothetical protein